MPTIDVPVLARLGVVGDFQFTETELKAVWLIEPTPAIDDRGAFTRMFCDKEVADCGLATRFVQHSRVNSLRKGMLRGLHFQEEPYTEVKLVSCVRGAVFDVVVDMRPQLAAPPPLAAMSERDRMWPVVRKLVH
jgi:dTDP-4-dehydrorhamnose 3,5-epimerase-like enzyme